MTILTTVFNYPDKPFDYTLMHRVFIESCKRHMPEAEIVTLSLNVPKAKDDRKPGIWTNTAKLRAQAEAVAEIDDDIIIADCDMICLRSAEDAFNLDFDIAYTVKPEWKRTGSRINGGIVFVRNNERAKQWVRGLKDVNDEMYSNPHFHDEWRKKYFGMNQTAMGYMIEQFKSEAKVIPLPTTTWNAVDCDWKNVDEDTRFVHIKSRLRHCILNRQGYDWMEPILKEWCSYIGDNYEIVEKMPWDAQPEPTPSGRGRVRGMRGGVKQ